VCVSISAFVRWLIFSIVGFIGVCCWCVYATRWFCSHQCPSTTALTPYIRYADLENSCAFCFLPPQHSVRDPALAATLLRPFFLHCTRRPISVTVSSFAAAALGGLYTRLIPSRTPLPLASIWNRPPSLRGSLVGNTSRTTRLWRCYGGWGGS
jgi:hypothetical protein